MQMKLADNIRKSRKLSRLIGRRYPRPIDSNPASLAILLVKEARIIEEPEWASVTRLLEVLASEVKGL